MPTVFIDDKAILLPTRFSAGDTLTETSANVLQDIHMRRLRSRLRWLISRGELAPEELQTKAEELNGLELQGYTLLDDSDDMASDPVMQEALLMAKEIIAQKMAAEGLPLPKNIEIHAKALVDGLPALQERARRRVEARYLAASLTQT